MKSLLYSTSFKSSPIFLRYWALWNKYESNLPFSSVQFFDLFLSLKTSFHSFLNRSIFRCFVILSSFKNMSFLISSPPKTSSYSSNFEYRSVLKKKGSSTTFNSSLVFSYETGSLFSKWTFFKCSASMLHEPTFRLP